MVNTLTTPHLADVLRQTLDLINEQSHSVNAALDQMAHEVWCESQKEIADLRAKLEHATEEADAYKTQRDTWFERHQAMVTERDRLTVQTERLTDTQHMAEADAARAEADALRADAKAANEEGAKFAAQAAAAVLELNALKVDASRWRGLIASQRIRPLGCAGLGDDKENDMYAHLGLEIWTTYPGEHDNRIGIDWLTKYADKAASAAGVVVK